MLPSTDFLQQLVFGAVLCCSPTYFPPPHSPFPYSPAPHLGMWGFRGEQRGCGEAGGQLHAELRGEGEGRGHGSRDALACAHVTAGATRLVRAARPLCKAAPSCQGES